MEAKQPRAPASFWRAAKKVQGSKLSEAKSREPRAPAPRALAIRGFGIQDSKWGLQLRCRGLKLPKRSKNSE
ncbi:MAG: hypothetical protein C0424_09425 [Sphingobacteriaceae bacterium]|nr:hypothetical protein [Sphingobacteriaceae bacterium]